MTIRTSQNPITISRKTVRREGGVVILNLKEYEKLRESAVPTYYLAGKEAEALDRLVREGRREYEAGKTKKIKSLSDLD